MTNATGNIVEQLAYDSFGNSTGSTRTRYGYTGRERDPDTGLLHYHARWYDPQVGRFISEDPIGFRGRDVNFYSYVNNDPLKNFDELEIDRAFISELAIVPSKKIRMTLLRGPREENAQFGREYDLQFNRIHDVSLNLQARPWLEIVSHKVFSKSKYLTSYFELQPEAERKVTKSYHFQVICDEGQIDVIAEEFSISLVNEIPYFESAGDEIIK